MHHIRLQFTVLRGPFTFQIRLDLPVPVPQPRPSQPPGLPN